MSHGMSKRKIASLTDRRNDLTRRVILQGALDMLEHASVDELTARGAAKQANVAERTVFRYFPSREAFLDAVAEEVGARLEMPPPPNSLEELKNAPRALYRAFESKTNLTKAALHSEIYHRMRESAAKERWMAVCRIIDTAAPGRSQRDRRIAAANIRYYLTATTWHYYRFYFGFSLAETILCAETAICDTIESICRNEPDRSSRTAAR